MLILKSAHVSEGIKFSILLCFHNVSWKMKQSGIIRNDPEIQLMAPFRKMADGKCNSTRIWEGVLRVALYTRLGRYGCVPIKDEQDCLCLHSMSSFLEWIRSGNILCHRYPPFTCRPQTIIRCEQEKILYFFFLTKPELSPQLKQINKQN